VPEVRTCARDGCEQTFEVNPQGFGYKRKFCDDHKVVQLKKTGEVLTPDPEVSSANGAEVFTETRPSVPKEKPEPTKGIRKLWGKKEDVKSGEGGLKFSGSEVKPKVSKRRVSTAGFWGDALSPVSSLVARGGYVPMARAMAWSAPVAGDIIEDATKGTIIDSAVQPICRNTARWSDLFDLLGFWAAIGVAQQNPATAPAALEFARKRMVNLLPRMAANIKKERQKEREAVEAIAELMPDIRDLFPEMGPNDDPVAVLIGSLFAMPEGMPEQETANVS
jgi:hypothetical protein